MAKYRLIPDVAEKIDTAMANLGIRPVDARLTPAAAIRHQARFYMTPVVDLLGQTVWFKAGLQDSPWLRRGLREETQVQRTFADYERRYRPHFDSPSFLAAGDDRRGFSWLLRKYWHGSFAGDMDKQFGLTTAFLDRVTPSRMAGILDEVRRMTAFMRRRVVPDVHGLHWYLLDFHYYRRHFFSPLLGHPLNPGWRRPDIDRMEGIFWRYRRWFGRRTTVFTHGDLYPNNILVRPGSGRVVLFDWELSHLNLPTFDSVMVYLQAWRRPEWQASFRAATMRRLDWTADAVVAWRLATLSLATRLTAFCFIRLTNGQPERYPSLPAVDRPRLRRLYRRHLAELLAAYHQELT